MFNAFKFVLCMVGAASVGKWFGDKSENKPLEYASNILTLFFLYKLLKRR